MTAIFRRRLVVALTLLLAACAGADTKIVPPDPNLTDTNAAKLILYQPERNYSRAVRVYPDPLIVEADGRVVGRLPYGRSLTRHLVPGRHRLVLREAFLGIARREVAAIEATLAAGRTYFLRYSADTDGISPSADVPATGTTPRLMFVDTATWLSQR